MTLGEVVVGCRCHIIYPATPELASNRILIPPPIQITTIELAASRSASLLFTTSPLDPFTQPTQTHTMPRSVSALVGLLHDTNNSVWTLFRWTIRPIGTVSPDPTTFHRRPPATGCGPTGRCRGWSTPWNACSSRFHDGRCYGRFGGWSRNLKHAFRRIEAR